MVAWCDECGGRGEDEGAVGGLFEAGGEEGEVYRRPGCKEAWKASRK